MCRELLTKSPEGRSIDLITISSHDKKKTKFETYLEEENLETSNNNNDNDNNKNET